MRSKHVQYAEMPQSQQKSLLWKVQASPVHCNAPFWMEIIGDEDPCISIVQECSTFGKDYFWVRLGHFECTAMPRLHSEIIFMPICAFLYTQNDWILFKNIFCLTGTFLCIEDACVWGLYSFSMLCILWRWACRLQENTQHVVKIKSGWNLKLCSARKYLTCQRNQI